MTHPARRRQAAGPGVAHTAPVFAALGDPIRLALMARLGSAGPQSIARLADGMPVTRQAITKHLLVLDDVGLVQSTRRGRERFWQCNAQRLRDARRFLDEMSRQWDSRLGRLKEYVEKGSLVPGP